MGAHDWIPVNSSLLAGKDSWSPRRHLESLRSRVSDTAQNSSLQTQSATLDSLREGRMGASGGSWIKDSRQGACEVQSPFPLLSHEQPLSRGLHFPRPYARPTILVGHLPQPGTSLEAGERHLITQPPRDLFVWREMQTSQQVWQGCLPGAVVGNAEAPREFKGCVSH